jgi:hypothetical protein
LNRDAHMAAIMEKALVATAENEDVDFKRSFNPAIAEDWIEIIKDMVAMANSGGGVILIGINNDGSPSSCDIDCVLAVDPANVTNKIYKYTDYQFHDFQIKELSRNKNRVCGIIIGGVDIPLIFTEVGTYPIEGSKQKTAFSKGTVYFRHGAKSEPGTSDDLRRFLDRQLERIKISWLDGIAKIVEAPAGSKIAVLPPDLKHSSLPQAIPIRIVDDPAAPPYYAMKVDDTHPYRQKDVVKNVNERLAGRKTITSHAIICIRRVFNIQTDIKFCYTMNYASPRYSQAFVDWIIDQYEKNQDFFDEAKVRYDSMKAESLK